ncbi:hypothetical protein K501DRAFT_273060 [Backusella circina FSU 941]|nr:hypothetical protein K501DRAFT_273060 [Backusella circina FSU 941]
MNKFPIEVLSFVFTHLHFCEKQECMLVCKLWADSIGSGTLFDTVHINEVYTFDRFRRYFDPRFGKRAHIKSLVMSSRLLMQGHDNRQHKHLRSWISKIEALEHYNCYHLDNTLLPLRNFSALKRLVVKNASAGTVNTNVLANAPNITSLTLEGFLISTSTLEAIHSDLVALTSLELENMTLMGSNDNQAVNPALITPSALVTRVFITSCTSYTPLVQNWLQYIRYKHTHLRELRFLYKFTRPIQMENEKTLITTGVLPLLQDIGCNLRLLKMDCSTSLQLLFERMKSLGSRQKKALWCFLDKHHFIRELTLNLNSVIWVPRLLRDMNSLKVLTIKEMHAFTCAVNEIQSVVQLEKIFTSGLVSLLSLRIEEFKVNSITPANAICFLTKLDIRAIYIDTSACW